jgi:hypothetical protein
MKAKMSQKSGVTELFDAFSGLKPGESIKLQHLNIELTFNQVKRK